jgi:hypothetical protein
VTASRRSPAERFRYELCNQKREPDANRKAGRIQGDAAGSVAYRQPISQRLEVGHARASEPYACSAQISVADKSPSAKIPVPETILKQLLMAILETLNRVAQCDRATRS